MEKQTFTRKELERDFLNHPATTSYNDETDKYESLFTYKEVKEMTDEELVEEMLTSCTWHGEVEIVIEG